MASWGVTTPQNDSSLVQTKWTRRGSLCVEAPIDLQTSNKNHGPVDSAFWSVGMVTVTLHEANILPIDLPSRSPQNVNKTWENKFKGRLPKGCPKELRKVVLPNFGKYHIIIT